MKNSCYIWELQAQSSESTHWIPKPIHSSWIPAGEDRMQFKANCGVTLHNSKPEHHSVEFPAALLERPGSDSHQAMLWNTRGQLHCRPFKISILTSARVFPALAKPVSLLWYLKLVTHWSTAASRSVLSMLFLVLQRFNNLAWTGQLWYVKFWMSLIYCHFPPHEINEKYNYKFLNPENKTFLPMR